MTTDMQGTEWRFDAVDLRPVLRWLERPEGRLNAEAVEVVAIGSGVTPGRPVLRDRRLAFPARGLRAADSPSRPPPRRRGDAPAARRGCCRPPGVAAARASCANASRRPTWGRCSAQAAPSARACAPSAGRKALLPLFDVRTRRRSFSLKAGVSPAGEITLDETAIRPPAGGSPVRLRRVEIEVPRAALDTLEPFVAELRDVCALRPAGLSEVRGGAAVVRPQAGASRAIRRDRARSRR